MVTSRFIQRAFVGLLFGAALALVLQQVVHRRFGMGTVGWEPIAAYAAGSDASDAGSSGSVGCGVCVIDLYEEVNAAVGHLKVRLSDVCDCKEKMPDMPDDAEGYCCCMDQVEDYEAIKAADGDDQVSLAVDFLCRWAYGSKICKPGAKPCGVEYSTTDVPMGWNGGTCLPACGKDVCGKAGLAEWSGCANEMSWAGGCPVPEEPLYSVGNDFYAGNCRNPKPECGGCRCDCGDLQRRTSDPSSSQPSSQASSAADSEGSSASSEAPVVCCFEYGVRMGSCDVVASVIDCPGGLTVPITTTLEKSIETCYETFEVCQAPPGSLPSSASSGSSQSSSLSSQPSSSASSASSVQSSTDSSAPADSSANSSTDSSAPADSSANSSTDSSANSSTDSSAQSSTDSSTDSSASSTSSLSSASSISSSSDSSSSSAIAYSIIATAFMEAKGHCCSANLGGQCQPMLPHDICGDDEYTGDIYSTADECKKECSCGNGKVENNEVCDLGKAGYEGADAGEDGKPGIGAHKMNVFSPGLPQNTPIAISIIPIASSREVPFSKAWQDNMIADGCLDTCKYAICYVEDPMAKTARKCYAEFTTDDPDNPTAICEIDITIPGVYIGDYAVVVNEDPGQDNSRCAGLMMKGRGINGEENPPHFSVREGPPELVIDLPK